MKISLDNLRRKGFVFCFREAMKRLSPLWWTRNRRAIDAIYAQRTYRYLRRRYTALAQQPLAPLTDTQAPKKIYICWLQGFENAPTIVKRCVASIEHYCPDFDIIRLDEHNMYDHATLPEHIRTRFAQGRIPFAHFTDVLRTAILVQHGGIWIDATVLLTAPIPKDILNEPLFMFQNPRPFALPYATSNWFILSAKAHPLMQRQLQLLSDFWQHEQGLFDYYMFYVLFYILITDNTEAEAFFNQMPYIPNTDTLILQTLLNDDALSEKQWRQACRLTPVHKLTWKISDDKSDILFRLIAQGK